MPTIDQLLRYADYFLTHDELAFLRPKFYSDLISGYTVHQNPVLAGNYLDSVTCLHQLPRM